MPSRAVGIINALYGREMRSSWLGRLRSSFHRMRIRAEERRRESHILDLYRERNRVLTRGRIVVGIIIVLVGALLTVSLVYYNRLTRLEQDVYMERAKIDCLLQRRRNISINLARTVRDYAAHEQAIFRHVTDARASSAKASPRAPEGDGDGSSSGAKPAGTDPAASDAAPERPRTDTVFSEMISMLEGSSGRDIPLEEKLSGLVAVAESYPDLKLSDNFRRFMEALIETEKDISDRRLEYSDVVNRYTTQMATYPGRLFAVLFEFEPVPHFKAFSDAERFHPVEY